MNWLLKFLPQEKKQLIILGQRIVSCLDTPEERREAIRFGTEMLEDGRVSVGEWSGFGSRLGILGGPKKEPFEKFPVEPFEKLPVK